VGDTWTGNFEIKAHQLDSSPTKEEQELEIVTEHGHQQKDQFCPGNNYTQASTGVLHEEDGVGGHDIENNGNDDALSNLDPAEG